MIYIIIIYIYIYIYIYYFFLLLYETLSSFYICTKLEQLKGKKVEVRFPSHSLDDIFSLIVDDVSLVVVVCRKANVF